MFVGEQVWSKIPLLHTNTDFYYPPSLFHDYQLLHAKIQRLLSDVLHILPTLVNLQGDDQLSWAKQTPSILGAENVLTFPSLPGRSSSTRPLFHMWCGRISSCRRTTSPTRHSVSPPCGCRTWWYVRSSNKYSFVLFFQNSSATCCFSLNSFFRLLVEVGFGQVGMVVRRPPCKKWADVKASGPSSCVKGRVLMAASILAKILFIFSSSTCLFPKTFRMQRFVVLIIRSHHHPHQATRGAINFQVMPRGAK